MCFLLKHFIHWPKTRPICVHAESKTTAAVLLLAELYKKPVHVCHVARKEEVDSACVLKSVGISESVVEMKII